VGLITGEERIGGVGPQMYHCYPGEMRADRTQPCLPKCEYAALTATAPLLEGKFPPHSHATSR